MQAWGGIAGLQSCMDVMFDEAVLKRGMSLPLFAKLMATNAADIFWSEAEGRILGKDADFVFIQPDSKYVLKNEDLEYRHKSQPRMLAVQLARITKPFCVVMLFMTSSRVSCIAKRSIYP